MTPLAMLRDFRQAQSYVVSCNDANHIHTVTRRIALHTTRSSMNLAVCLISLFVLVSGYL